VQILEVVATMIRTFESGSSFVLKEVRRAYVKGTRVETHAAALGWRHGYDGWTDAGESLPAGGSAER